MIYNDEYFYQKLELNILFDELKRQAILTDTKNLIDHLNVLSSIDEIEKELSKVDEAFSICNKFERCPIYVNQSLEPLLDIASKGGMLTGLELYEFVLLNSSIRATLRLLDNVLKEKMDVPYFKEEVSSLVLDTSLDNLLRKSIGDDGVVLDDASPELKKIRNKLRGIDERIKHRLQEIMGQNSSYLADSVVVIRNDHYCLCIKAEYKNTFRGILQDLSSSSLTAYMEPIAVAEMASEKDKLRNEEKEEINRILRKLSNEVGSNAELILNNYNIFKDLDLTFSKGILALSYDGAKPHLNTNGALNLVSARHPLLKVKKVIPNNINFGKNHYGIIITGPNTGGKTVLLKTVGLLCLMVKFGLLIPASPESNVTIYDHIYCDIGDDQSILDNLSTFSSHMEKMVAIVNQVTPSSLALFDEIGAGTDPTEGASLAIAVLKYFIKRKVSFITTTHYADLKAFAYSHPLVVNASMAFNNDTNQPTYQLVIGRSGSSNAYHIARNLGLKQSIIDSASASVNKTSDEISLMIKNIENKSHEIDLLEEELKSNVNKYNELVKEYEERLKKIDAQKEKLINKAHEEASDILNKAIDEANNLLDEIKEYQNKGLKLHEIIEAQTLINEASDVASTHKPITKKKKSVDSNHVLAVGDTVHLLDFDQFGIINRIRKDGSFDVEVGNLSIHASVDELEYVSSPVIESSKVDVIMSKGGSKSVSLTLDLRGVRAVEATDLLDKYIDDLICASIGSATIIHGFGTGVIRELVQNYCKKCKNIKSYRYGGETEGGFGVTVITLK